MSDGGALVAVNYREYAAKGVLEALRKLGILLLVDGPIIRTLPTGKLRRYPGMIHMIQRYSRELRVLLDGAVE